jgi:orotidine-5'-phosphate decarboxylase
MNGQCGLLVNASRSILYAGHTSGFASSAREAAQEMQQEMARYLLDKGIIPSK